MRIAIQTLGTRGDVQPYLALALGLIAHGHRVQLSAPAQFEPIAAEVGIPFAPLPAGFLAMMDTPEGKAAMTGGRGFRSRVKLLKTVGPLMRSLLDAEWAAAQTFQPELIVYHPKALAAPYIAEWLTARLVLASPLPGFTPTAAFPTPMLPFRTLGPLNRASHQLATRGAGLVFSRILRDWREASVGLRGGAIGRAPDATLYAYSQHVVPVPADWPGTIHVTGYWFLDSPDWTPSDALATFLAAGPPPVYFGFGSMPAMDPEALSAIVAEALARTGKRGVLATGGGALRAVRNTSHLHTIEGAPHDRLFPLMSAIVHHGGAGTTGAALRAGKPMVICPFFGDQPFWARRVADLGVGPPAINLRSLNAEKLAAALLAANAPQTLRRAEALGALTRRENGTAVAIDAIEALGAVPGG